jgi:hypothetical protein
MIKITRIIWIGTSSGYDDDDDDDWGDRVPLKRR